MQDRWADGTIDSWSVQTLQPLTWLAQHHALAGREIALDTVLDLKEMGAPEGLTGTITSIALARPSRQSRPGCADDGEPP